MKIKIDRLEQRYIWKITNQI